jgi:hypothetical protein
MDRDMATAGSSLRGSVFQRDHVGDLALGIRQHPPGDRGNLIGAHSAFDRQEKHDPISERVSPGIEFSQDGSNLFVGEDFRLFAESHQTSRKVDKTYAPMAVLYYRLKLRSIESRVKARRNAGLIGESIFSYSDPRCPDFGLPGGWCDVPVLASFPRALSPHSGVGARGMAELPDHEGFFLWII